MRARTSGTISASLLYCALILLVVTGASAADQPLGLKSADVFVTSAPIIEQPSLTRVPVGAGAATNRVEPVSRNISLDFHAADITDVLKALSMQAGKNIVTGTDVKGQVTVSLSKVSFQEALDMVTKLSGYKYAETSPDTYIIGSDSALSSIMGRGPSGPDMVIESVPVLYAQPDVLAGAIAAQIPTVKVAVGSMPSVAATAINKKAAGDEIQKPITRTIGVIILNGPADDVQAAKNLIAKVEASIRQGGPNTITEVYNVRYSETEGLVSLITSTAPAVSVVYGPRSGFNTDTTVSAGTVSPEMSGAAPAKLQTQSDTLILTGPEADVNRVLGLLQKVDVKQKQILIEAKILDLSNDASKDIGMDWSWSTFQSSETIAVTNDHNRGTPTPEIIDARSVAKTLTLGPFDLSATLSLMIKNGKARLLANPKVAVLSGKPASVFIGDEVKYVISIQNTTTGQNIETDTANPGILLNALGVVGPEGDITLTLHPEVSVITSYLQLSNGIALPQIARRYSDSTLRIKSGQTVAIGGLIREQEIETMSKVPYLSNLPFLGQLFQHRKHSKDHSEVAMLITATILDE